LSPPDPSPPDPGLLPLLASLFLPAADRERLLARAHDDTGGPAASAGLRAEGREVLLGRLQRAARPPWPVQRRRAAAAAGRERPRLAELLGRTAEGVAPPAGAAPLLLRLVRERLSADGR